ncbi:tyrosine--tRNA ligase, partial [Candidatus Falkowbacteria bacterium]|nr:tyrosine--tRNA ligase [Candidatus Falkowbacteria bacterium]
SKGEARRNIDQKGVKVNEEAIDGYDYEVKSGDVIQKGKRFFIKIK